MRRAPYGSTLGRAGYDVALAAAAFEQPVTLLFMDDGVWHLLPDQQGAAIDSKTVCKTLDSLALYDIDELYVDTHSLARRDLAAEDIRSDVQSIGERDLGALIARFNQVVSF